MEKFKVFMMKKENMIVAVLLGILLLVVAVPLDSPKKSESEEQEKGEENYILKEETAELSYAKELEARVEEILSCMEGVGSVKVMITLSASKESIVEKDQPSNRNIVEEKDAQGGSRNTNDYKSEETTVYTINENGDKIPYVIKTVEPEIEGVTVVAQGGGNPTVQKNICEALQALFHIEIHKIKVVKMK